jgi:anti-sigma factor RsiW
MTEATKLTCTSFQQVLTALLTDRASFAQRVQAEQHLQECEACCQLWSASVAAMRKPQARQQFVVAVLDKLQLAACVYCEEQLEAYMAQSLPADAVYLLDGHLAECQHCKALVSVMRTLTQQLPALVHRAAPLHFTAKVLAATSGLARNKKASNKVEQFGKGVMATMLLRPRFAAEAAFCCTLLWTLFAGVPTFNPHVFEKSGQHIAQLSNVLSRELVPALSASIPESISQELRYKGRAASEELLTTSGNFIDLGSERAKAHLHRAQQQLQTLYEQGAKRLSSSDGEK